MPGRYRTPPKDAMAALKALTKRTATMERTPRATQTTVDRGTLSVKGGTLSVRTASTDPNARPVLSAFGSLTDDPLAPPDQFSIYRNVNKSGVAPTPAIQFIDTNTGPSLMLGDRAGSNILADAHNVAALGMGDPRIHVQFFDPNAFTTFTSSSFTTMRTGFWYLYCPHLRVTVLVQNDVGTTSEVRVVEQGGAEQAIFGAGSGAFQYVDLIVDRRHCINGTGPNGNIAALDLQARRVSGAGNAKVCFAEAISIDLSTLW